MESGFQTAARSTQGCNPCFWFQELAANHFQCGCHNRTTWQECETYKTWQTKVGTEKFCTWNTVGTKIALNCHLLNCLHSKRYGTTGWQCRALRSLQKWIRLNWIWINTTFHGVPRVHIFSIRLWGSIALNNVQGGIGENHAKLLPSFFNIEVGKLVEGQASGKVPCNWFVIACWPWKSTTILKIKWWFLLEDLKPP